MMDKNINRFEILRQLAITGSEGDNINTAVQTALKMTVNHIGLTASSLYVWDNDNQVKLTVSHAENNTSQKQLTELEDTLFVQLRQDKKLVSAYMSFGGVHPYHSFTLPLRYRHQIFGAVIGIQTGERSVVSEDIFLEALSALLSLNFAALEMQGSGEISQDLIDRERLRAILDTAVTVNHEVNNPLQAIIGNIQLIKMKNKNLDKETLAKLQAIEESAMKITEVTQKLMRISSPKTTDYSDGTTMIDISDNDKPDE
jgi:K+-sensing histidine kinase KdpD